MYRPHDAEPPARSLVEALTGADPEHWPLDEDAGTRTRAALITDTLDSALDAADKFPELPDPEGVMAAGYAAFLTRRGLLQQITSSGNLTPQQRAERARASWDLYRITWGEADDIPASEYGTREPDTGTRIADLLADLVHLAVQERSDLGDVQTLLDDVHETYLGECEIHLRVQESDQIGACGGEDGLFTANLRRVTCTDCLSMHDKAGSSSTHAPEPGDVQPTANTGERL